MMFCPGTYIGGALRGAYKDRVNKQKREPDARSRIPFGSGASAD